MTQITDSDREAAKERDVSAEDVLEAIVICRLTGWHGVAQRLSRGWCPDLDTNEGKLLETLARHRHQALSTQSAELDALRVEVKRLQGAFEAQMREKHKEKAEARLWFTKAQEWKAQITQLRDRVAALEEGLRVARGQFAFYVEQHLLKSPPDEAKAKTNQAHVGRIDALLTQNEMG